METPDKSTSSRPDWVCITTIVLLEVTCIGIVGALFYYARHADRARISFNNVRVTADDTFYATYCAFHVAQAILQRAVYPFHPAAVLAGMLAGGLTARHRIRRLWAREEWELVRRRLGRADGGGAWAAADKAARSRNADSRSGVGAS